MVATRDRVPEDPEHMARHDEALDDALVAIVIAADHIGPTANYPRSGLAVGWG